jgi:hypothetical protein
MIPDIEALGKYLAVEHYQVVVELKAERGDWELKPTLPWKEVPLPRGRRFAKVT